MFSLLQDILTPVKANSLFKSYMESKTTTENLPRLQGINSGGKKTVGFCLVKMRGGKKTQFSDDPIIIRKTV